MNARSTRFLMAGLIFGLVLAVNEVINVYTTMCGLSQVPKSLVSLGFSVVVTCIAYFLGKNYANQFKAENEGFMPFQEIYLFYIVMAALAGIIAGITSYITINHIVGFDKYVDVSVKAIAQSVTPETEIIMKGVIDALRTADAPKLLSTISSSVFTNVICALVVGGCLSLTLRKKRPLFENVKNDEE